MYLLNKTILIIFVRTRFYILICFRNFYNINTSTSPPPEVTVHRRVGNRCTIIRFDALFSWFKWNAGPIADQHVTYCSSAYTHVKRHKHFHMRWGESADQPDAIAACMLMRAQEVRFEYSLIQFFFNVTWIYTSFGYSSVDIVQNSFEEYNILV